MRVFGFLLILAFLTGCSEVDPLADLKQTSSGALSDFKEQFDSAVEMGKSMQEGISEMIEDTKDRINQVQSGVDLLLEGKEMIEGGVSGE